MNDNVATKPASAKQAALDTIDDLDRVLDLLVVCRRAAHRDDDRELGNTLGVAEMMLQDAKDRLSAHKGEVAQ